MQAGVRDGYCSHSWYVWGVPAAFRGWQEFATVWGIPCTLPGMLSLDYGTLGSGRLHTFPVRCKHCLVLAYRTLGGTGGSNSNPYLHSFVCECLVYLASHVENPVSSPLNDIGIYIENQLIICAKVYFWDLYSIPLSCMSVLMPVQHGFDDYTFVVRFGIRNYESSNFILLFQNCFGHFGVQIEAIQIPYGVFLFLQKLLLGFL